MGPVERRVRHQWRRSAEKYRATARVSRSESRLVLSLATPGDLKGTEMTVATPWMLITGCAIVGWLAPEIFAAILKRGIPMMMNILGATAFGLIAASLVR